LRACNAPGAINNSPQARHAEVQARLASLRGEGPPAGPLPPMGLDGMSPQDHLGYQQNQHAPAGSPADFAQRLNDSGDSEYHSPDFGQGSPGPAAGGAAAAARGGGSLAERKRYLQQVRAGHVPWDQVAASGAAAGLDGRAHMNNGGGSGSVTASPAGSGGSQGAGSPGGWLAGAPSHSPGGAAAAASADGDDAVEGSYFPVDRSPLPAGSGGPHWTSSVGPLRAAGAGAAAVRSPGHTSQLGSPGGHSERSYGVGHGGGDTGSVMGSVAGTVAGGAGGGGLHAGIKPSSYTRVGMVSARSTMSKMTTGTTRGGGGGAASVLSRSPSAAWPHEPNALPPPE
jgi:hypothetical protein